MLRSGTEYRESLRDGGARPCDKETCDFIRIGREPGKATPTHVS